MHDITIDPMRPDDLPAWRNLRHKLGPEWVIEGFDQEAKRYFDTGLIDALPHMVLAARRAGIVVGFAEVSLRAYAEGAHSSPVGYLEGWFVDQSCRGLGAGRQLVEAAESWARLQGCREFASDAEIDNDTSRCAHLALGFEEVCAIRCFLKKL